MVGWLVGWLVGRSVGRSFNQSVISQYRLSKRSQQITYLTLYCRRVFVILAEIGCSQNVSKLLERAVHAQLLMYLNENELLPSVQSAYRQFFSTETAVLKVVSDVLTAMDRGQITLLGMFDLSAAFDTVDHAILLKRLDVSFGIRGNALNWFASYLSGRSQQVSVHGILASSFYLDFGGAARVRAGTSFVSSLHCRSCCIGAGLWSFSACLCR